MKLQWVSGWKQSCEVGMITHAHPSLVVDDEFGESRPTGDLDNKEKAVSSRVRSG